MSQPQRGGEQGEGFHEFTETGPPGRRLTQTLSDRARAVAIAAERPEPPGAARPGEAALRVGAGAGRETAGQASPVEGGAP